MDKLEQPIFIKENIIRPMFNKEFAKELVSIAEWLGTCSDDAELIRAVSAAVKELIEINKPLIIKYPNYEHFYSCDVTEAINIKAMISERNSEKDILTPFGLNHILYMMRGLMCCLHSETEESVFLSNAQKVDFLYLLFKEIYAAMIELMDRKDTFSF